MSVGRIVAHKEGCAGLEWNANFQGGTTVLCEGGIARCDCGAVEADGKAAKFWLREVLKKLEDYTGDLEDFTL
jgi:hypothetical protein